MKIVDYGWNSHELPAICVASLINFLLQEYIQIALLTTSMTSIWSRQLHFGDLHSRETLRPNVNYALILAKICPIRQSGRSVWHPLRRGCNRLTCNLGVQRSVRLPFKDCGREACNEF